MSATVYFPERDVDATVDRYLVWSCKDKDFLIILIKHQELFPESGADPNPPLTSAERMAELFGGSVISFDKTKTDEIVFD